MQTNITLNKADYDNMVELQNQNIDHVIIKNKANYYLVIHGLPCGGVCYNGFITTFQELSEQLRKELNLLETDELICYVICCYGLKQTSYIDNNTYIVSMFSNDDKIYCELENDKSCTFSF